MTASKNVKILYENVAQKNFHTFFGNCFYG